MSPSSHLLGVINRETLAYMLLESPLLVLHRPAQEYSQTGTWTECGYNPPARVEGSEQLDLCPVYQPCPFRERVYSSPCSKAAAAAARASPLQSPTADPHQMTAGQKGCTQPVCHTPSHTHSHRRIHLHTLTFYKATLKECFLSYSVHIRGVDESMAPGLKITYSFYTQAKWILTARREWVSLLSANVRTHIQKSDTITYEPHMSSSKCITVQIRVLMINHTWHLKRIKGWRIWSKNAKMK